MLRYMLGMRTHVFDVSTCPVLPAKVDERIISLLDVDHSLSLVRGHRAALQAHLPSPELHKVLAGRAT